MNIRSEGDGDEGNIISSGYHAVLLAGLSCCWTAVFLLFTFPPFPLPKNISAYFILFYYPPTVPPSKKEIYSITVALTLFSSPCVVLSAFFLFCVFSFPLLPIGSPLTSSLVHFFCPLLSQPAVTSNQTY